MDSRGAGTFFLTGANGFIGRAVAKGFVQHGFPVVGLVRAQTNRSFGWTETAVGAIESDVDWQSILENGSTLIHLAGLAHRPSASEAEYFAVNAEATRRLAEGAVAAGVKRFVFVSTIGVNGAASGEAAFCERDAPKPVNAYARSKALAETYVKDVCSRGGVEWTIVRPPMVYGFGAPGNFGRLVRLVDSGLPMPLGAANQKRSFICINNLVSALMLAATHVKAANRLYLVRDDEEVSVHELVKMIGEVRGRSPWMLPVPLRLVALGMKVAGYSDDVVRLLSALRIDQSSIRDELGWTPGVSLHEGMRRALGVSNEVDVAESWRQPAE